MSRKYKEFVNNFVNVVTTNFDVWVNRGVVLEANKFSNRAYRKNLRMLRQSNPGDVMLSGLMFDSKQNMFLAAKYLLRTATDMSVKMRMTYEIDRVHDAIENLFVCGVMNSKLNVTDDEVQDALVSADDSFMVDQRMRYILHIARSQVCQYN